MNELDELRVRLVVANGIVDMLSQEDDPRAPDALIHYQEQREEIVRRIQASNPPPVVVNANVATLGAKGV